jgi:hypothetical protein
MKPITVSRIVTGWLLLLMFIMSIGPHSNSTTFYTFGPNTTLTILGFHIDTYPKYILVVIYAIINTIIRSAKNNIISPWITLNIQDESKPLVNINKRHAYEMSLLTNVYGWIDWLIYVNMLLSQVDMIVIEITCDLMCTMYITRYYLSITERQTGHTLLNTEDIEINGM